MQFKEPVIACLGLSYKPNIDDLKKVARQTGMHTELDHGKLLVARGITSVEELQRSLKK